MTASKIPGAGLITWLGTAVAVVVIGLVLFGPEGMAGDFLTWLGGKIATFIADMFSRLPEDETRALGGTL